MYKILKTVILKWLYSCLGRSILVIAHSWIWNGNWITLYSTLKSSLSLTVRPFVTSFRKFLFACNLYYCFLGTSYFVFIDTSDGDCGGSLCCDRSFIIGECFWSALMYTLFNKNQAAWYYVRPAQAVTWRTVAIIIRIVLLSPYLCIRGVSLSSIHYNQSRRMYTNKRHQHISLIWS